MICETTQGMLATGMGFIPPPFVLSLALLGNTKKMINIHININNFCKTFVFYTSKHARTPAYFQMYVNTGYF